MSTGVQILLRHAVKPMLTVSSNQNGGILKMSDIDNKSNNQKKKLPICFICDMEISRKNSFTENYELSHENIEAEMKVRANKCPKCGKSFTIIENLKRHFKSLHVATKPYDCEWCNHSFLSKGNLRTYCSCS